MPANFGGSGPCPRFPEILDQKNRGLVALRATGDGYLLAVAFLAAILPLGPAPTRLSPEPPTNFIAGKASSHETIPHLAQAGKSDRASSRTICVRDDAF